MAAATDSHCDYCGLPTRSLADSGPQYCCYGCQVAAAITSSGSEESQTNWQLTRLGLAIFFTMNVMVCSVALWSWDVYRDAAHASPTAEVMYDLLRYASFLLASIVTVLLAGPLLENAIQHLLQRRVTTDLLIVAGVLAAMAYSVASLLTSGQHIYFEVACLVLVGVTFGRWLEAIGKLKTTNAIRSLERLLPEHARVVEFEQSGRMGESLQTLTRVAPGQCVRVLPGERIPFDGLIRRGQGAVDEQIVNGESIPAIKESDDSVFAGTLNLDGDLIVEVTAELEGGALLRIIDAVTDAARRKCRLQTAADAIAEWFVPAVIAIAIGTLAFHAYSYGAVEGLMAALAVVLIACPCALGVATPLAMWAAMGRASRLGILFRDGDAVRELARVKVVCFDKTGTLTTGMPAVEAFFTPPGQSESDALDKAAALAAASSHVFSNAIREFAWERTNRSTAAMPQQMQVVSGRGVAAQLDGLASQIYLGNLRFMQESQLEISAALQLELQRLSQAGQPLACVGWEGQVRGVFSFCEDYREHVEQSLQQLRAMGKHVEILTGDHAGRAARVERDLNTTVRAELSPEQKRQAIGELRKKYGRVAMVGDGINDAPALAEADVGVALGCGADVSRETAGVCLLSDQLPQVVQSMDLARRTMRGVYQNLFWALIYNAIGILFAASGWLNPIWAAVAMVGSSLFVVTNSLRLTAEAAPPSADQQASAAKRSVQQPQATTTKS